MALRDAPRVVVLTTFDVDDQVYAALKGGASGFLTKDTPPERLADAVRSAARGDTLLAPAITRRRVEAYTRLPQPTQTVPERLAPLTTRELEVLAEIARGLRVRPGPPRRRRLSRGVASSRRPLAHRDAVSCRIMLASSRMPQCSMPLPWSNRTMCTWTDSNRHPVAGRPGRSPT